MKNFHKSLAFVTQKYAYKESSFVCNIFSQKFGKGKFMLYGATKNQKQLSNYQVGSIISIEAIQKTTSEWLSIYDNQLVLEKNPKDYNAFSFLSFILEWVLKCEFSDNLFEKIFEKYHSLYQKIDEPYPRIVYSFLNFFFQVLRMNGFALNWKNCKYCQQTSYQKDEQRGYIFRKENYDFEFSSASIVCSQCCSDKKFSLQAANIKIFFHLFYENEITAENIPPSLLAQNLILLLQAYLYHYPMRLKSAENLMNCLKAISANVESKPVL